jgi:peptidoglycan/LPS O-acetylase OafA/YrhL
VTIFFMLTGYLFWKKARTAKGKLNAWKLWRGRIFRIAPLYCFSLGFVLIIAFLKGHTVLVELKNWRQGARLLSLGALAWKPVGNADFGQYDAYVTWTLLWEWRFYALLPLLGSIAIGRRTYWLALLMYLISAVALWHYRVMPMWLTLGLTFVPGMICGVVLEDQQLRSRLSTPAAAVLALLAMSLIGLVIFFVAPIEWRNASLPGALLPVFAVSAAGNSFFGFLTQPAIRCLGTISYSLYLLHGIIYYVIVSFLKEMGFANLSGLSFWLIITAGAVGTAVLSAATYRWVEFPFIFRGHSLTAQKK